MPAVCRKNEFAGFSFKCNILKTKVYLYFSTNIKKKKN